MLTQEELPAEPGSGFAGSFIVESTSTTTKRSATGLLCITLMPDLDNVLGRAAKAGRRPVIMVRGPPVGDRPGMAALPATAA